MTRPGVGIRRATARDAVTVAALLAGAGRTPAGDAGARTWRERLRRDDCYTYVAEDTALFGIVRVGEPAEAFFDDGATGEVLDWYVRPDHGGEGYGARLLVHGLTVIKRLRRDRAIAWIPVGGHVALQVATRLGFEPVAAERVTNRDGTSLPEQCVAIDLSSFF